MTGPQTVSGDHDKATAHHDAMLREIESLRAQLTEAREMSAVDAEIIDDLRAVLGLSPGRSLTKAVTRLQSQLAEARETLARVAQTLDWDAPPEQVPSGIPDLAIAVQELRRQRDQARTALAEAREQRDQAAESLVRAETERDKALCAIAEIAEMLGFPGDLRKAIRALRRERDDALQEAESVGRQLYSSTREVDRLIAQLATVTEERDRLRRQVLAVAEDLERYASDPEGLPMSERKLAWTLRQIVERSEACRCGKPAGHCSHCHDDPPAQTVADALDDAVGRLRDMLLRALAEPASESPAGH